MTVNYALQSQTFSDATWTSAGVCTDNVTTAPDSTSTAAKFVGSNASNALHNVTQSVKTDTAFATVASVYVKKGSKDWINLNWHTLAGNGHAWFNVNTGVVGTHQSSVTSKISNAGNGWYRCTILVAPGVMSTAVHTFDISACSADNVTTCTSDGSTTDIFLWGAQIEKTFSVTQVTSGNTDVAPPTHYAATTTLPNVIFADTDPIAKSDLDFVFDSQTAQLTTNAQLAPKSIQFDAIFYNGLSSETPLAQRQFDFTMPDNFELRSFGITASYRDVPLLAVIADLQAIDIVSGTVLTKYFLDKPTQEVAVTMSSVGTFTGGRLDYTDTAGNRFFAMKGLTYRITLRQTTSTPLVGHVHAYLIARARRRR